MFNKYELFKKAGGRLALSLYVLLHNASAGPGGGERAPTPHEEAAVSVLKNFFAHLYVVVFGVFWGGLGYFEAVGFQKRNLAHYMNGDGLVVFGVFWVGLGYFEAVGFQKRNLAYYMYGDALVGFGVVWGGLGCFNGPHDGYANRSNSKTSLLRVNR